MVGIDLIGPLKESQSGNKYILALTDLWSKFVEAFALPSKSADLVCDRLQSVFYRFGPSEKILTDQGKEFCNELNDKLFSLFQIKHLVTLAYHPQTNSQVERTNQTLKGVLRKLVNKKQDDWDKYLEAALFGIRTSVQSSTKYSPFFLMFSRQPRLFIELQLNETKENNVLEFPDSYPLDESVESRISHMTTIREKVDSHIAKAQSKQKQHYELKKSKGYKSFDFKIGMKVLIENSKKQGNKRKCFSK